MDKYQALNTFWNSFGLTAYDENTVPDNATLPHITYEAAEGSFGDQISLTASIWYRSRSWADATVKAEAIASDIGLGGKLISFDNGRIWIKRGTPFSQRMSDPDSSIRRISLNIEAEFISAN